MSNYWESRRQKQQDLLYDKKQKELEDYLVDLYRKAFQRIEVDAKMLWLEITEQGKTQVNNLYRYNRYFVLMNTINSILSTLGSEEIKITEEKMMELYLATGDAIEQADEISFTLLNEQGAKKAIEAIWCADGKHWSSRVWEHKQALQQKVERGIVDCIVKGDSKDKMVETLMATFGSSFSQADRIVRTELTYVQNQACKDSYVAAGFTQYKFLAAIDERTSEICQELNKKVFRFADARVGENFPPCHPNCRSTIVAARESEV